MDVWRHFQLSRHKWTWVENRELELGRESDARNDAGARVEDIPRLRTSPSHLGHTFMSQSHSASRVLSEEPELNSRTNSGSPPTPLQVSCVRWGPRSPRGRYFNEDKIVRKGQLWLRFFTSLWILPKRMPIIMDKRVEFIKIKVRERLTFS